MKLIKPQRADKYDKPGKQNYNSLDIKKKAKGKRGEQERKTDIDKETNI